MDSDEEDSHSLQPRKQTSISQIMHRRKGDGSQGSSERIKDGQGVFRQRYINLATGAQQETHHSKAEEPIFTYRRHLLIFLLTVETAPVEEKK